MSQIKKAVEARIPQRRLATKRTDCQLQHQHHPGQVVIIESSGGSEINLVGEAASITHPSTDDEDEPSNIARVLEPSNLKPVASHILSEFRNDSFPTKQSLGEDAAALRAKIDKLQRELEDERRNSEDYKLLYEGLYVEHAEAEESCHNISLERDAFQAKYNELLSERFNRQIAGLWIAPTRIKNTFCDLCIHVTAWCDSAVYQAVKPNASKEHSPNLAKVFDLCEGTGCDVSSSSLTAVLLSTVFHEIVSRVFPSDDHTFADVTDLWTTNDNAEWIADITDRMDAQGVSTEDVRLWLCLTTTALAPEKSRKNSRTKALVDSLWKKSTHVLQLTPESSSMEAYNTLKENLQLEIVPKAVELSRLMRKCRTSICVRWPSSSEHLMSQSNEEDTYRSHLILTTPELVTRVPKAGTMQESILVASNSRSYATRREPDGRVTIQEEKL